MIECLIIRNKESATITPLFLTWWIVVPCTKTRNIKRNRFSEDNYNIKFGYAGFESSVEHPGGSCSTGENMSLEFRKEV